MFMQYSRQDIFYNFLSENATNWRPWLATCSSVLISLQQCLSCLAGPLILIQDTDWKYWEKNKNQNEKRKRESTKYGWKYEAKAAVLQAIAERRFFLKK